MKSVAMQNRGHVSGKLFTKRKIQLHQKMIDEAVTEAINENGQFVFGSDKKPLAAFIQKQEQIIGILCMTLHQCR